MWAAPTGNGCGYWHRLAGVAGLAVVVMGLVGCAAATNDRGLASPPSAVAPSATALLSATAVPTASATPIPTVTAVPTATVTPIPTATAVPTATATPIPTASPTAVVVPTVVPTSSPPTPRTSPVDAGETLGVYRIVDGGIDLRDDRSDAADQAERVWKRFSLMVPGRTAELVVTVGIWDLIPGNAFVVRDWNDEDWQLHVAADIADETLDDLLLHEYNHIIVLTDANLTPLEPGQTCHTWRNAEGCAATDSILARFVSRFWSDELIDATSHATSIEALAAVVAERPNDFVSLYAATSPVEDLAETWVRFVRLPRPERDGTIATAKIDSLWDEPELWRLRAAIRLRLSL